MVLAIIIGTLVHRFRTRGVWVDSWLFGLFVYLIFLGLLIISKLIPLPTFLTNDYILTPLLYFFSVILLTSHPRFRVPDSWKLALWVAGAILITKLLLLMLKVQALLGIGVTI